MTRAFGWRDPSTLGRMHYAASRVSEGAREALPVAVRNANVPTDVYDQGSVGSCFPAGTPISMADGSERPIDQVAVGNIVIDHKGTPSRVSNVFERDYTGDVYTIRAKGWKYPLSATSEHPIAVFPNVSRRAKFGEFKAGELEWTAVKDVKIGDFVLMPSGIKTDVDASSNIDVMQHVTIDVVPDPSGHRFRVCRGAREKTIPMRVALDEKFARLIGFFLAEGSYRKSPKGEYSGITFTFHRKEDEYHRYVRDALNDIFGVDAYIEYPAKRLTCASVRCDNTTLANFFHAFCGEHAFYKFVNPVFFTAPIPIALEVIRGWLFGDGTQGQVRVKSIHNGVARKAVMVEGMTSSLELHRGMFRLSLRCGMKPGAYIANQSIHQNAPPRPLLFSSTDVLTLFPESAAEIAAAGLTPTRFTLFKRHELGFLCRVEANVVSHGSAMRVYNLEVEGEHTYVANAIAVHNCTSQALALAVRITQARCGYVDEAPSRADIYWRTRASEGTTERDAGAMIADGVEALRRGWMPESAWPHEPTWGARWTTRPPALAEDAPRVVNAEALAITVDDIAWSLASGEVVVCGFRITKQWEELTGDTIGEVDGPSIAGHAVALIGYSRDRNAVRVRNSWSKSHGDGGEFWLDFDWLRLGVCGEAFAIRAVRRAP